MRTKTTTLPLLIVELGLAWTSLAQNSIWSIKSPLPLATSLHSANVVDGKIYVIGGTDTIYRVANDYYSTVRMYDPATDTWTRKADLSRGRGRSASAVVDGKIYAIGGSPRGNSDFAIVEMYDPATDTWTRKSDLPRGRCFLSASAVNGKIYVIGGKIYPSATMVATVEEYDPVTDTWTRKSDMPTARGEHAACVVNGKIYVMGGGAGAYGPIVSTVEMYDPITDTWTRKADLPTARAFVSASVVNGKIYAIGGGIGWAPSLATVEVYDPSTDTWSQVADMPTARAAHSSSVVDGKIYVMGGTLAIEPWVPTPTVEAYKPMPLAPDFNRDGIVNIKDLTMLIEHWGQNDPMCDIAPWPSGDEIVDVTDLELLMSYWDQEVYNPNLLAHWKLDESAGDMAYDSAGLNDAVVLGSAVWQPDNGNINGALLFDGSDDYVDTLLRLNPAETVFSIFVWIKGGAPGQVVMSQKDGVDWLIANEEGCLMTALESGGRRSGGPLISGTTVTDGDWHRIGFTWNGSDRVLYADDVEVARDTIAGLQESNGDLCIGAGSGLEADTFWSGMIDNVRIYDRVVVP